MADITVKVGALTSSATISDAIAVEKINLYIEQRGGPTDAVNQEKIDWFVQDVAHYIDETAGERAISESLRLERERILEERRTKSWGPVKNTEPVNTEILSEFPRR